MALRNKAFPLANFIWDFDGTLVESYEAIIEVLNLLYDNYQLPFDLNGVSDFIIENSIGELLEQLSKEHGLPLLTLKIFFNHEQEARDHMISLMPGAKDLLDYATGKGIRHFIITHKGSTTEQVLTRLGIKQYFTEVITATSGFARKPDSESFDYLLKKYKLDKSQTFYIGDRPLDREFAENSKVMSINLREASSEKNIAINDLSDIKVIIDQNIISK
ncbi:HAD-IA family hydrolase [Streptococcus iniae]|uniref:HAD-IA family hydrolase n=1 Tax=Streptococcus iniae TaxID=1346 RepID=UPI002B2E1A90|nr:HAD-IA family hydrolase [Streptococcus iniae]